MPRGKKYRAEEIIPKLREAEILISQGNTQALATSASRLAPVQIAGDIRQPDHAGVRHPGTDQCG